MSRYGIDYYGLAYYGPDTYVDFSASSFDAIPWDYGSAQISWTQPGGAWSKLVLVRNSYGFPTTPFDGVVVGSWKFNNAPTSILDEESLSEGAYYYYSLFVYNINQYMWEKAGDAQVLSVKNFGNQDRLWSHLPDVYKLGTVTSYSVTEENAQLKKFLNLFGFWLDYAQTETSLLINRYDVQKVNVKLLPLMLQQFGFLYESEIGGQQARVLLRDAIQLQKEKGSLQGLEEYIKSFSGYLISSPVTGASLAAVEGVVVGHNLMLDYNDSSFEENLGHWVCTVPTASDPTTKISRVGTHEVTHVSLSSNVATLTIGSHGYSVGDKISVTECISLFNGYGLIITNVSATTVSYALVAADLPQRKVSSGKLTPNPFPWDEPTSPVNYPNKQDGLMSISRTGVGSGSGTGDITVQCGINSPIDEGIPVTPGETYTFSFRCTSRNDAVGGIKASILWYDRLGSLITTVSGSAEAATGTFGLSTKPYVTSTAPANAYYAVPQISATAVPVSASYRLYVDACQFEASSSATEFDEARNLHITLKANRINELVNPHFEAPYTPWSFSGGTATTVPTVSEPGADSWSVTAAVLTSNTVTLTLDDYHHLEAGESVAVVSVGAPFDGVFPIVSKTGKTLSYTVTNADIAEISVSGTVFHSGSAVELTSSGSAIEVSSFTTSAQYMPIYYPSSSYSASIFFRAYSGSISGHVSISWYDLGKTLISSESGAVTTAYDQWNRMYVTSTAPSNAAYASMKVVINTAASGDKALIDEALFERSAFALDYFDGDAEGENVSLEDVFWEGGVANAGRSHYYKNRVSTIYRLKETLPNFLPAGSTFALYLAQPNT